MDLIDELEGMAAAVDNIAPDDQNDEAFEQQIKRFQDLFHYSYSEARDVIMRRRANLSRKRISDAHWKMIQEQKEAEGYDRETYEYAVQAGLVYRQDDGDRNQEDAGAHDVHAKYLVKLKSPIDSPRKIQDIAATLQPPITVKGTGTSNNEATFCLISSAMKNKILSHLGSRGHLLTFIRISMADKDLSDYCMEPMIGSDIDPTLPQHRARNDEHIFLPAQDQYPVWYFFYGTLADPGVLATKLSLLEHPVLRPATVTGGILTTWGGKYKGLIDGPASATVDGWAYQVMSKEHEEQLRYYETERYEVVRCEILMRDNGESVKGLTFRFLLLPP
jgi:AIG2-like family.